jgi:hypothetical protein
MNVDSDKIDKSIKGTLSILGESPVSIAGTSLKISMKESQEIGKSHMSGGSRTAPLHKVQEGPFLFPSPQPAHSEKMLSQFFTEMRQNMARLEAEVKKNIEI